MIFYGRFVETKSGRLAPFVEVFVHLHNGIELASFFLIDTGADATFLPASFLEIMGEGVRHQDVSGVGSGTLEYFSFDVDLFLTDVRPESYVPATVGVLTATDALDEPVLGADVLDQFTLIIDPDRRIIALLDPSEPYTIGTTA